MQFPKKLDWRFVSREFKEKLKEIQTLGPGTRMHFCLAPQWREFNGKSLADVYGLRKLEDQEWRIPESEYGQSVRAWRRLEEIPGSGDRGIGGSGDLRAKKSTAEDAESGGKGEMSPQINTDGNEAFSTQQSAFSQTDGNAGTSEQQEQAKASQNGMSEAGLGIPIEHLAMFKPAEAMELLDRVRRERSTAAASSEEQRRESSAAGASGQGGTESGSGTAAPRTQEQPKRGQWELGYAEGEKRGRERARQEIEKELRARLGLPDAWQEQPKMMEWHKQQLKRLEKADAAPRCEWVFAEGTPCHAPKMKGGRLCYAHERMEQAQRKYKKLNLLVMEDASSIIMNLSEIGQAVANEEITDAKARILLSKHRLGLQALKLKTFDQTDVEMMVTQLPKAHRGGAETRREKQSALSNQHSAKETVSAATSVAEQDGNGLKAPGGSRSAAAEQVPHARQNTFPEERNLHLGSVRDDTTDSVLNSINPGIEVANSFRFGVDGDRTPEKFCDRRPATAAGESELVPEVRERA